MSLCGSAVPRQPWRKNGLKGSIIALFHALPSVCQKSLRWWIEWRNLRLVKAGLLGPSYCLIQCQARGHDRVCTLIYWAKLVPLLHINIDERERGFGGQSEVFSFVPPAFSRPDTSGGEARWAAFQRPALLIKLNYYATGVVFFTLAALLYLST